MAVIKITKNNFTQEVLNSDKPVLIDFWASWCGPCHMIAPTVEEISNENLQIKVGKINIDEENDLARQFDIYSIPTLLVFKNGKVANKAVGVVPKANILKML